MIISHEALRGFIERIEELEEDKRGVADDIKAVYAEAKSQGFDPKVMRAIVTLRRKRPDERQEFEELLAVYEAAIQS